MLKKIPVFLSALLLATSPVLAANLLETRTYALSMETYLRTDLVTYKNVDDLNSKNKDDHTTYIGIDYSLSWDLKPKEDGPEFYLKFERHGPGDYSAPLFINNTLINSGGRIEKYRNTQLLPDLEEAWIDAPLVKGFGFKAGLYTYEVANGFSLNGAYKNYGATLYQELDSVRWRIYYCRPEIYYKHKPGPKVPQDAAQGYEYNTNASNFFSLDARFGRGENYIQPYIGVLADYTSSGKRDNIFSAPVKEDLLGTIGFGGAVKNDKLFGKFELAHNFGEGLSTDSSYKNITHTGYFAYAEAGAYIKKFSPSIQFLLASGNKVSPDEAQDSTLPGGKNRAFSSYSPLNQNLGDTISAANAEARPVVLMGAGFGLHNGLPRPKSLADSDFDNLIMPSIGMDIDLTQKLKVGLRNYYAMSFARPVGMLDDNAVYLSRELGDEIDFWADYKLNKNITLSFLGGYFFPGAYYKENRSDTDGSLLSPCVSGSGDPDSAFQLEFSVECTF